MEFALVVPFFLFMVFSLVTYGVVLAEKQKVTNTAADAARSAVGVASDQAVATAKSRITSILGSGPEYTIGPDTSGGGQPKVDPCEDVLGDGHKCITVTITYEYGSHPIVPAVNIPVIGHLFTPDKITTNAKVRIL